MSALRAQAAYYIVTGVWPLVSMRSFEAITGRKFDRWLVKMVGLLAATNGLTLALAASRTDRKAQGETIVLSIASALAFSAVDVVYALKGTISKIYLADAVVEALLIAAVAREASR